MSHTLSLLDASILRADILVTEAGNADVPVSHDLAVDPAGALIIPRGILIAAIGPGATFANAAAAQTFLDSDLDVEVYLRSATSVGNIPPALQVTAGVSAPGVSGNFRFILSVLKGAVTDVATIAVMIKTRWSASDS